MLISADHGNLEQMLDATAAAHAAHGRAGAAGLCRTQGDAAHGALRDLAPTVLALMDLPQPAEMTGHSLVRFP